MQAAIKARYGARRFKVKIPEDLPSDLAASIPLKAEIIYGHMPYGIHETLPVRYATVLREPVSRSLSHYRAFSLQKAMRGFTVTLDDFLFNKSSYNLQTAILSGLPGPPSAATLALAKKNLETFEIVGFFDDLDAFARRIDLPTPLPHIDNASPAPRNDPTPEQLERIRARNALDAELYQWAKARFGG